MGLAANLEKVWQQERETGAIFNKRKEIAFQHILVNHTNFRRREEEEDLYTCVWTTHHRFQERLGLY